MGGEDWLRWVERMKSANLLSKEFVIVVFSYIAPELTRALYRDGTIGAAKRDLEDKSAAINQTFKARESPYDRLNRSENTTIDIILDTRHCIIGFRSTSDAR